MYIHIHVCIPSPGIVNPPLSVNITLSKVAVLNCTAIATWIIWLVNGEPIDDTLRSKGFDDYTELVTLNETQDLRLKTLNVTGSSDSNGTSISCFVALFHSTTHPIATSEPALILVQGTCV